MQFIFSHIFKKIHNRFLWKTFKRRVLCLIPKKLLTIYVFILTVHYDPVAGSK